MPEARRGRQIFPRVQKKRLFAKHDFLTAYGKFIDLRVAIDPQEAIGGYWEEIGGLQFRFLVENGLQPHHRLLDIGCGTLRGGRHFIRYLDAGNYAGFDLSPKAIEAGRRLVTEEGLGGKKPDLRVLPTRPEEQMAAFRPTRFDFLLAQSVFSHLGRELIEEFFAHAKSVMAPDGRFFFTFLLSRDEESHQFAPAGFSHPVAFFEEIAQKHGYSFQHRPDYSAVHPRKQHMGVIEIPGP